MDPDLTAQIIRQVVVGLLAVTFGAVGSVLRLHYRAWRRAPSTSGLIPLHVAVISAGQLCFLTGAAIGVLAAIDADRDPPPVRTGLYIAGCVLTLAALYIVGKVQRARIAGPPGGRHRLRREPRA